MNKALKTKILLQFVMAVSLILPGGFVASAQPTYTEVELTSLQGEIFVNPGYIGKVRSVRTIDRSGLLGDRVEVELRIMTDNWRKFTLPPELSGAFGIIVSGENGILKISLPAVSPTPGGEPVYSIDKLLIEFGVLNTTFVFPPQNVLEPSKFKVGLLDNRSGSFIPGNVIVMKSNELAADFKNLPSAVVNSEGQLRVNITSPSGSFINAEIPAWGYNISVPETDISKPAAITAEVFGLDPDSEIRFDFTSLADQVIVPSTKVMTVKEINSGATVATITTKIGGPQPLTVTVKRVQ